MRVDRPCWSWTIHAVPWDHAGDRARVSSFTATQWILLTCSWWEAKEHVLRRKGQEDKRFTITAVPLMVGQISLRKSTKLTCSIGQLVRPRILMRRFGPAST